jgi:hypothetical protein
MLRRLESIPLSSAAFCSHAAIKAAADNHKCSSIRVSLLMFIVCDTQLPILYTPTALRFRQKKNHGRMGAFMIDSAEKLLNVNY